MLLVFGRAMPGAGSSGVDLNCQTAVFQPPDTLRPEHCQPFAVQVEVDQSKAGAQPVMVLRDSPVSHLVEAEDAFQYSESMFYFGSHSRLRRVLARGYFADAVLELCPATGHVLRVRRGLADGFSSGAGATPRSTPTNRRSAADS